MSASAQAAAAVQRRRAAMGTFEQSVTFWVALCIVAGIALGAVMPGAFHALGGLEITQVNIPVAVLIWLTIVPMLLRVDSTAMGQVARHWRGIAVTLGVNWLVKLFSMALLGWLFVGWLFRPWLPAGQVEGYIAGSPARCGPLHGDGLRLEQAHRRRTQLHAVAGRAQQCHHGGGLRARSGPAA